MPPALTLLDADGAPVATYPLDAEDSDSARMVLLVSIAKVIEWTDAPMAVLATDTYVARQVEGSPWPIEPAPDASRGDLDRLFRARDPRVFEAINVVAMHDSKAEWMGVRAYRYTDGELVWEGLDTESPEDGEGVPSGGALVTALRAGFEVRAKRQVAGVPPLAFSQAAYVLGLHAAFTPEA